MNKVYANTSSQLILSFLSSQDEQEIAYALTKIAKTIDNEWHIISNHVEQLIHLQQALAGNEKQLASSILSKLFYHMEQPNEALNYALHAGKNINLEATDKYTRFIISRCAESYCLKRQALFDINKQSGGIEMMERELEEMMNTIFEISLRHADYKGCLGLAVEARRVDILEKIAKETKNLPSFLQEIFKKADKHIQSQKFRNELLTFITNNYQSSLEGKYSHVDLVNICTCYFHLNLPEKITSHLQQLILGNEDDFCLALQIVNDLQENENTSFNEKLENAIKSWNLTDIAVGRREKMLKVLSGQVAQELGLKFLSNSSKSDKTILVKLKEKNDQKSSILRFGTLTCHALMQAGTADPSYLVSNLEWAYKSNHWARFSAVASLGVIHHNNFKNTREVLKNFLPPGGENANRYTQGGALYAIGLLNAAHQTSTETNYLLKELENNSQNETIAHGALLGIGLVKLASNDHLVLEILKNTLNSAAENAVIGEAAGYAIGLVIAGSMDLDTLEMLYNFAQTNPHEKIARASVIAMALIMLNKEELAEDYIKKMVENSNSIIRYGGVLMIAMAYVGTSNSFALRRLLKAAVTDVSDETRRAAATSVGFVMINNPEQIPKMLAQLAVSYNPHVRYGTALAVGIACAGSINKEAIDLIEPMLDDPSGFVRQGVAIGLAMIVQQGTKSLHEKIPAIRNAFLENALKKSEDLMYRVGCMVGLGIIDAGGRNSIIKLRSEAGSSRMAATAGMLLFSQFWYWYPLVHMISLSFAPSLLVGITNNLKVPVFELKSNSKPSVFEYYPPIPTGTDSKLKDSKSAVLSTTEKVKHRLEKLASKSGKKKKESEKVADTVNPTQEKMVIEEPDFMQLKNPSRVLPKQEQYIKFDSEGRYVPLLARTRGFVFLKDKNPGTLDQYFDDNPLEKHLIPPPDFYFDESSQQLTIK